MAWRFTARMGISLIMTKAVIEAVGADRTAIRFSPFSEFQNMGMPDADREATFSYLAREFAKLHVSFVHLVEPRVNGNTDVENVSGSLQFFLDAYAYASPVVLAGGYKADNAKEAVEVRYKNLPVIIAFGRPFIANPDLPFRIKKGIEFTPYNRDTFYNAKEARGYTDYPFSEGFAVDVKA
ncbi:hypothetical protein EYB25_006798 [Talaromyces marneffei]|nr:hypothetical protein EYB25_006798 [Talaromyces marneffei]